MLQVQLSTPCKSGVATHVHGRGTVYYTSSCYGGIGDLPRLSGPVDILGNTWYQRDYHRRKEAKRTLSGRESFHYAWQRLVYVTLKQSHCRPAGPFRLIPWHLGRKGPV